MSKYADRLRFTAAAATSAATLTFSAAIAGFRTPAQVIADGASDPFAIKVGDTNVCFVTEDSAGNKETALYTVTSATVLTRTSTISSTAGGTTPATFNNTALTVFNDMSGLHASKLATGVTDATSGEIELKGGDGLPIMVMSPNAPVNADGRRDKTRWLQTALVNGAIQEWVKVNGVYQSIANPSVAISNPVVPSAYFRSIYTMEANAQDTSYAGRAVMRDSKRTSVIIRNPNARPLQYSRSTDPNGTRNNPGNFTTLAPGQEVYITADINQYWVQPKQYTSTALSNTGTTVTATVPSHGLSTGDLIICVNANPGGYRAASPTPITVVDANTFTYQIATSDIGAATGQGIFTVSGLYYEIETMGTI